MFYCIKIIYDKKATRHYYKKVKTGVRIDIYIYIDKNWKKAIK